MLGDKLRFFRKKANLSQKQLAEKIGFPQTTVSDWELNKYEPGFTIVVKIAKALNIEIADFVTKTSDMKNIFKAGISTHEE